jgi:hypothetical protein
VRSRTCADVCARARARACVRACACACAHERERACVYVLLRTRECACMRERMCNCAYYCCAHALENACDDVHASCCACVRYARAHIHLSPSKPQKCFTASWCSHGQLVLSARLAIVDSNQAPSWSQLAWPTVAPHPSTPPMAPKWCHIEW